MQNFVIVGLGRFGQCMLDNLVERRMHVIVIDRDVEKVQRARDKALKAVKADAVNFELLKELLPERLDCAIVDLGDVIGQSILVTNYLAKLSVPQIVVEAVDIEHAEILRIVGATRVVFPEREAADRVAGMLAGGGLVDFFAVSKGFSMIEIPVPAKWIGHPAAQLGLRQTANVEVVAVRKPAASPDQESWGLIDPARPFEAGDLLLLAGHAENLSTLTGGR